MLPDELDIDLEIAESVEVPDSVSVYPPRLNEDVAAPIRIVPFAAKVALPSSAKLKLLSPKDSRLLDPLSKPPVPIVKVDAVDAENETEGDPENIWIAPTPILAVNWG
jgi:hypothetical protein